MKKIITIIIMSLICTVFFVYSYKNIITSQRNLYITIETDELISKIERKDSFILFFYQKNCISCKQVASVLNEYIEESGVEIFALDLSVASKPGFIAGVIGIEETPVLIIFEKGEEINRLNGIFSLEEFEEFTREGRDNIEKNE